MKMRVCLMGVILLLLSGGMAWGQWSEPVLVDTPWDSLGVNGPSRDWCPYVTVDGQYLYFASWRGDGPGDLYVSHMTDSGWGTALKLPFCTLENDERNPSVNSTNDTLYFIRWAGNWDIWWAFRTGPCDTCWGEPERLPEPINSSRIEFSVWCTPDNERLLFSSTRTGGMGGEDIYECRRDATTFTGWSVPSPLPGHVNSWGMDSYPSMGFDTTELFYWQDDGYLYVTQLSDSGWQTGERLPDTINRIIIRDPSEITPAITPDGRRLYFSSRWSDSTATAGDIWYTERELSVDPCEPRRSGEVAVEVFPNPATAGGMLTLDLPGQPLRPIVLYNLLGQEVYRHSVSNPPNTGGRQVLLTLPSGIPSGVYFANVVTAKESVVRKVIVHH
ncbi:T9SS type A sorting domain-containing protein [bacterium]|nr:T9SS type A sorting domain-containing protein [bacterium]MBU1984037.1 T9SS type A sorting domain-containing protein [bacterium]